MCATRREWEHDVIKRCDECHIAMVVVSTQQISNVHRTNGHILIKYPHMNRFNIKFQKSFDNGLQKQKKKQKQQQLTQQTKMHHKKLHKEIHHIKGTKQKKRITNINDKNKERNEQLAKICLRVVFEESKPFSVDDNLTELENDLVE